MPFSGPKWPFCHEQIFWYKPLLLLSSTYWTFSLCQILKNSYSGFRVMMMCPFWAQNGSFAPHNFFLKIINVILMYLLATFIVQNFKNILPVDPELWGCTFLGPKWPISTNENVFRKTLKEPCFFHLCLSTCQKSKSDINLFVKYWCLNNIEISLAEIHYLLKLENQIFPKHAVFTEC